MNNLTELRALRAKIIVNQGFVSSNKSATEQAVEWIAGELTKSPLTVWGWFNRNQLTPIPDNTLELLRLKLGKD